MTFEIALLVQLEAELTQAKAKFVQLDDLAVEQKLEKRMSSSASRKLCSRLRAYTDEAKVGLCVKRIRINP